MCSKLRVFICHMQRYTECDLHGPFLNSVLFNIFLNFQDRKITKLIKLLDTAVVGRMAGADRNSEVQECPERNIM